MSLAIAIFFFFALAAALAVLPFVPALLEWRYSSSAHTETE